MQQDHLSPSAKSSGAAVLLAAKVLLSCIGLEGCVGFQGSASVSLALSLALLAPSLGLALLWLWAEVFSRRRPRSDPGCTSNRRLPAAIPRGVHLGNLQRAAVQKRPRKAEELQAIMTQERELPTKTKARGEAWSFITWRSGLAFHLSTERAGNVDMDHVKLCLADFLWTCFFVGPNTVLMHIVGLIRLKLREGLHRLGFVSPVAHDPAQLVYRLLMESFLTIHYQGTRRAGDGTRIAMFMWHDVPALDGAGEPWTVRLFTVDLDLDRRRMVQATLDERVLTEKEAIVFVTWIWEFVAHVKIHSVAPWGINAEQSANPFLRRMAVVTAIYNFYGFRTFPLVCRLWHALGLTRANYSKVSQTLEQSQDLIPAHGQIRELSRDSALVDFVIKVRNDFLNRFVKHTGDFPGIDGEALLVGTVFHSLDHAMLERAMEDPLWLDVDDVRPELAGMAEMCRLGLMCFNKDLPCLLFSKRCRDAPRGSFFHKVYMHAASINQDLADEMDCCICK